MLAVHEAINGSPMRYLLLEDPIPAGTEFIQSEDSYPIDQRPGGWYDWFTRREFHDDHAAFFASDFSGRQEIFYLIRVVNPGNVPDQPGARASRCISRACRPPAMRCSCRCQPRARRSAMIEPRNTICGNCAKPVERWLRVEADRPGAARLPYFDLWLHVPDASAIEVIGSVLLAFLIVSIAGVGESAIVLQLCGHLEHREGSSWALLFYWELRRCGLPGAAGRPPQRGNDQLAGGYLELSVSALACVTSFRTRTSCCGSVGCETSHIDWRRHHCSGRRFCHRDCKTCSCSCARQPCAAFSLLGWL